MNKQKYKVMKKTLIILILIMGFSISSLMLMAQDPPPPPSEGHGQNDNQLPGGGAPLTGGIGILLLLCSAYGGYKIFRAAGKPSTLS